MKSRFDGTNYEDITSTAYSHAHASLATYMDRPFIAGNGIADSSSKVTEIMNMESGNYEWERLAGFPGAESQHRRSVMNNFSNVFQLSILSI